MKKERRNKSILLYAGLLILAVFVAYSFISTGSEPSHLDDFAKCITENGATMYGAEWCPHCKNQKEMFGDSFQYVNYVECTINKDACLAAGVKGYPTWKFSDGTSQSGEVSIQFLSQKTGCSPEQKAQ